MKQFSQEYWKSANRLTTLTLINAMKSLGYKADSYLANPNNCYRHKFEKSINNIPGMKGLLQFADTKDVFFETSSDKPPSKSVLFKYIETIHVPRYEFDFIKQVV